MSRLLCVLLALLCVAALGKKISKSSVPPPPTYKVVLVTGCSSGIGKAVAMKFAESSAEEFHVYATMRAPERFRWTSDSLLSAEEAAKAPTFDEAETAFRAAHPHLHVGRMDVTDAEEVSKMVTRVVEVEGRVDVLVNNAGVGLAGCLETVDIAQAQALFDVNVWGPVRVMQAVLPYMRAQGSPTVEEAEAELRAIAAAEAEAEAAGDAAAGVARRRGFFRKGGYIINLSSTSGVRGVPGYEMYTGSKFALEGIADSMRYSLAAFGVSITNVNAGPVNTPFSDKILSAAGSGVSGGESEAKGSADLGSGVGRRAVEDATGYLQYLGSRMTELLKARSRSSDVQSAADVAQVVLNLVTLRNSPHAHSVADVPFNIGTDYRSQAVIDAVRKHPTGWTGAYLTVLDSLPSIHTVVASMGRKNDHQQEL